MNVKNNIHTLYCLVLCSLLFRFSLVTTNAQQIEKTVIKGLVVDEQTNEPLPFAGIFLEGTKFSNKLLKHLS